MTNPELDIASPLNFEIFMFHFSVIPLLTACVLQPPKCIAAPARLELWMLSSRILRA